MVSEDAQWWKHSPRCVLYNCDFTHLIKTGLYYIDKEFCKEYIEQHLSKNNKTNKLIRKQSVYYMLYTAYKKNNYIEIDSSILPSKFSIMRAFYQNEKRKININNSSKHKKKFKIKE